MVCLLLLPSLPLLSLSSCLAYSLSLSPFSPIHKHTHPTAMLVGFLEPPSQEERQQQTFYGEIKKGGRNEIYLTASADFL